jgi:hypothetical protein
VAPFLLPQYDLACLGFHHGGWSRIIFVLPWDSLPYGVDRSHVDDFQRFEATRVAAAKDIFTRPGPGADPTMLRCTRVVKQQQPQTMDDNGVAKVSLLTFYIYVPIGRSIDECYIVHLFPFYKRRRRRLEWSLDAARMRRRSHDASLLLLLWQGGRDSGIL